MQAPSTAGSTATLDATFRINVEVITWNLALTQRMSPVDVTRYIEIMILLLGKENPLSENPAHLEKIKNVAKNIISSPEMGAVFKVFGGLAASALTASVGLLF